MEYPFPPCILSSDNLGEVLQRIKERRLPLWLAMNKGYCGTGVERVAYRCSLSNFPNIHSFQFGPMVAKETLRADRIEEHIGFHKSFCETQSLASHLGKRRCFFLSPLLCRNVSHKISCRLFSGGIQQTSCCSTKVLQEHNP
jgi:hypothetical protein